VGRAVEVRAVRGEAARAGVVGERPPDRVAHREHEAAARLEHPAHLAEHGTGVRDERQRAVGRARQVEGLVAERQELRVALDHRQPRTGGEVDAPGVLELAVRQVDADHRGALAGEPPAALPGPAPHLEDAPARDVPEQAGLRLVEALRAPDEAGVAEELAVLALVVVGRTVPPGAVRARGLGAGDRPPHHPHVSASGPAGAWRRAAAVRPWAAGPWGSGRWAR